MTMTQEQKAETLDLAQTVLERLESDRLTRVPLLHLKELPPLPGVYFAATEENQILYIGKASDFTERCKISTHHKLPKAIEHGAVFLYIASVPSSQAWHVEQWLIDALNPPLNKSVSYWWVEKPRVALDIGSKSGNVEQKQPSKEMKIVWTISDYIPELGEQISKAREASGKTTAYLAREAGMSKTNWFRIENEEIKSLPVTTLKRMENALGVDLGSSQLFKNRA
jgi:DNA-binding XRE family transcriptional regulator